MPSGSKRTMYLLTASSPIRPDTAYVWWKCAAADAVTESRMGLRTIRKRIHDTDDDTHPGEHPMKPGAIWSPVPTAAKLADTGENC